MIVDVFMFNDEFDMLDCRLYELAGVVDRFIAIEADHTFSGLEKPYHLTERAADYADRPLEIVRARTGDVSRQRIPITKYVTARTVDAWKRETKQRDAAQPLLADLPKDAVIIYGDLDEIPRSDVVANIDGRPEALWMYLLMYSVKYRHPFPWCGGVIGQRMHVGTLADVPRYSRGQITTHPDAGWHLSWFGTPEARVKKLHDFAHIELVPIVGDKIGFEYPSRRQHVEGKATLIDMDPALGLPRWVEEGLAPAVWYEDWAER